MTKYLRDFISEEPRDYRFKMGTLIASSLSGFIVGFLLTSIAWLLVIALLNS